MLDSRQAFTVDSAASFLMVHGQRIAVHGHIEGQLLYPVTGVLAVVTASGTWIAPANRAVWTPAGFEHHHRAYGTTDIRLVPIKNDLARKLPAHPAAMAVSSLLRAVLLALTNGAAREPDAAERLVHVVVDELVEAPDSPLYLPEPHDDRLRAVTELLHSNPATSSTLAELGQAVGASERTLSRLFRSELNVGFRQWRKQLRIHHSVVHLAEGRSVTETAMACGWSNPSTFIEAFSAALGETPGRYHGELRQLEQHG